MAENSHFPLAIRTPGVSPLQLGITANRPQNADQYIPSAGISNHPGDRAGDRFRLAAIQLDLQNTLDRPADNRIHARRKTPRMQLAR